MRWFLVSAALVVLGTIILVSFALEAKAETWECYVKTVIAYTPEGRGQITDNNYKGKPITHLFVREGEYFRRPAGPTIYNITRERKYKSRRSGRRSHDITLETGRSNRISDYVGLTND